jgi:hypothetical protein
VEAGVRDMQPDLTLDQRKICYEKIKTLLMFWRWNGLDLPLSLLALFAILGTLPSSLTSFAYVMAAQFLMTLLAHHYFVRRI